MNDVTELLVDSELLALCIDDGHSFVDNRGVIYTDSLNAPKLADIREYVQSTPGLLDGELYGKAPLVEMVNSDAVQTMLEIADALLSAKKGEDDHSEMGGKLLSLCQSAVNAKASDVHLEVGRKESRFLLRVDGKRVVLKSFADGSSALRQSRKLGSNLAAYAFQMKGNHNYSERVPLNDRFELTLQVDGQEKTVEWRAALMPLDRGIKLVLRCITPLGEPLTLSAMDLLPTHVRLFEEKMKRRSGIIVLTGPMGSGKSSLVYALLETVDRVARCVHTLEDPVEFEQDFVTKTLVEPRRELKEGGGVYLDYTFYALEQLRQDIDITSFGELRSKSATKEFTRKGETGGLALSTLHANSAVGVPAIFIEHLNIPASVVSAPGLMQLFTHQKLIRKLCPHCALTLDEAKGIYDAHDLSQSYDIKLSQLTVLLPEHLESVRMRNPEGCEQCKHSPNAGEKGRVMVLEMIALENDDREFIKAEDYLGWEAHLESKGWPNIRTHTLHRMKQGLVDIESASEQVDELMPVSSSTLYEQMQKEMGNDGRD
ncbi:ATPase, T2SS/T4P/T4SS family (plasmid) [Vibrio scophthalmi]|uniref:GspE/PulE family protein n=1 Tax=Vibrio scophthalmi TaxID=45658 RepID=UPI000809303E|nr:ATPase, T2SS/T4P/T4SS family [Vibrio scophthalmi]ANS88114.1 Type II secretion system protein E [Vibrio scophthalmi]